jgi:putative DNA primase/helicase
MSIYAPQTDTAIIAHFYHRAGLCVIPIQTNGTRIPLLKWKRWEWEQLAPYFNRPCPCGIGIVCGEKSGNLEVLDFDCPSAWEQWRLIADALLLASLPIVATPSGGHHIYWRCFVIGRKGDLARDETGHPLVELKGEGGMITAAGSPLSVHSSGKPYVLLQGNPLRIPVITSEQREALIAHARTLNRYSPPPIVGRPTSRRRSSSARPGDIYNQQADWRDILEAAGWSIQGTRGETTYWTKPFSRRGEVHATTNYRGSNLMVCFTSNAPPFTAGQSYTKFAAYALLNHKGDYSKAARALKTKQL